MRSLVLGYPAVRVEGHGLPGCQVEHGDLLHVPAGTQVCLVVADHDVRNLAHVFRPSLAERILARTLEVVRGCVHHELARVTLVAENYQVNVGIRPGVVHVGGMDINLVGGLV